MLKEIELQNFRSHKKTNLKFTEGNNIFVGISGSGKSTVLDAICFAFFGTTPKIQKRKLKVSDLILDKPFKEEIAKIKLTFELEGKNYEIKREIYLDKPSNAELRENERLIATNQAQVTEVVEHILKIDYELFSKVIYAEQNQIDYFLTIPPGNRMGDIDKLLKLSKFELARAKTISISNKFKNLKNAKEETLLGFDENNLKNNKKEGEEYLDKLAKELIFSENKIRKLTNILEEKEKILKNLEKSKIEIDNKKNKLIELRTTISVFQNEIKGIPEKDLEGIEKEFKDKEANLLNLEKEELKRERETAAINSKISEFDKNLIEKKQAEAFLKNFNKEKFKLVEKELEKLKESLLNTTLRKQSLDEAITNLKEAKEKCPTCDRELVEEKRKELIDKKEEQSFLLNKKISEIENKLSSVKQEFETENKNLEKANFFKKRIEQLKNIEYNLTDFKKKLDILEKEKKDISGLKQEVDRLRNLFEKLKSVKIKKQKLKELELEQETIENEIKRISFNEREFEKLKKEVEEIKRDLLSSELNFKYKEEIKIEKEKNLEQIKKDLEFLEKNKKEVEFLDYAFSVTASFGGILIEVQELLRQEFVQTLNEVMNELWGHIYPYEDYIGIRFKIENKDYLLQLCDLKNKWVNVEGFSSGGERAIASLVMRVALSIILAPNLKLLVLDEPTHNLDSNTIENLTEILRTKIVDLLDQVFIVTHDERLIQAGTAYIYEFMRERSKKEPTKVKELGV
jgi:exonuclease SbcC